MHTGDNKTQQTNFVMHYAYAPDVALCGQVNKIAPIVTVNTINDKITCKRCLQRIYQMNLDILQLN